MERKAFFFDIDGTIWDFENNICESTVRAMSELQKKGHLTFICTGRSRGYVQNPKLLALDFDGIVSGCGTMIELGNEIVFYNRMDEEKVIKVVDIVRKYGFKPILEGREYLYFDKEDYAEDWYGAKLIKELGDRLLPIKGNEGHYDIAKLSCKTTGADVEGCYEELKSEFDFIIHNEHIAELVPVGFNKGTGILKVCELLDLDVKNTFAFGDSCNDISMLEVAGKSVVMGNGEDRVKEIADYVTTAVTDDGIWNACKYYGVL